MSNYYLKLPENSYPKSCKNCWIPCGFAELGSVHKCPFIFTEDEMKKELLTDLSDIKIIYKNIQFTPEELGLINKNICNLAPNQEIIKDAPTVLRCRDCKHSEYWYRDRRRCFLWADDGISVSEEGFCNYAERRTDV